MKKLAFSFITLFMALLFLLIPSVFGQVSFLGSSINKNSFSAGEEIGVNASVANRGNDVRSDLKVYFELIRKEDNGLVSSEYEVISLDGREVKELAKKIKIPSFVFSGNYMVFIEVYGCSSAPLAFVSHPIKIESSVKKTAFFGKGGVYLKIPLVEKKGNIVRKIYINSYGSTGENIPKGETFFVKFKLWNPGEEKLELKGKIKIIPSYSEKVFKTLEKNLGTLKAKESKEYEYGLKINRPGTYRIVVEVYSDNMKVVQKEVRAVVKGEGGSIIKIANSKDTYKKNEQVEVDLEVVGPADGITVVKNAYVKLNVIKNGNKIKEVSKDIAELSFNPFTVSFKFKAPETLNYYSLYAELGKEGKVYDSVRANYEPLNPERVLTEDGRVMMLEGCFDNGICTEKELEFGNCLDCGGKGISNISGAGEGESKKYGVWWGILAMVVVLIISFGIIKWWRK